MQWTECEWKGRRQEGANGTYPGKRDTGAGSWRLVHLSEDKSDLGVTVKLNDASFLHFMVQVVTLASSLADAGKDGVTTVGLGNVVL